MNFISRLAAWRKKHERYQPAAFFVVGFLFDILTLSRIDDWLSIVQQAVYLFIIIQILKCKTLEAGGIWRPSEKFAKLWNYSDEALHFILGSLLSLYTLFYFVSSSLATSFLFMAVIFTLLIANELPQFQRKGLILKYTLLSVCLFSFLFIIVPTTLGFIGLIPFLTALIIGLALPFALYRNLQAKNLQGLDLKKTIIMPSASVAGLLLFLYLVKLLPPIPLSIQYIGIYHQIEKIKSPAPAGVPTASGETRFLLKYDRPFWKIWQNGAQDFTAEPGDKIHCFVRIFAPVNFKDKIIYHWLKKYPDGWQTMDKIPNEISGGRSEGFRGFAIKSNFEPGEWRVQVETINGQEIGRIGFHVSLEPTKNLAREFKIDEY